MPRPRGRLRDIVIAPDLVLGKYMMSNSFPQWRVNLRANGEI